MDMLLEAGWVRRDLTHQEACDDYRRRIRGVLAGNYTVMSWGLPESGRVNRQAPVEIEWLLVTRRGNWVRTLVAWLNLREVDIGTER